MPHKQKCTTYVLTNISNLVKLFFAVTVIDCIRRNQFGKNEMLHELTRSKFWQIMFVKSTNDELIYVCPRYLCIYVYIILKMIIQSVHRNT